MWISRVVARAFGPFTDETLELAPGMNVVAGPNEAGKSSWHSAIRLAVTGIRRGRGRAPAADAALDARHRPWDARDRWEVEARLWLADGRQIDMAQDLGDKVACRAVDVSLGRDVSDEILDGTPDASRWLGLDRDAFAATVCVSQAQILAVADTETAGQLQEFMQRAAATRGTDATAAEAIDRLTEFRRRMVGVDRAAAKGPLRMARLRQAEATERLQDARSRHASYLERAAEAERAAGAVAAAQGAMRRAEAAAAAGRSRATAGRLRRAEELAARYPDRPAGAAARDDLADRVATALDAWQRRPALPPLDGPGAAELEERIAALPATPSGDLQPDAAVLEAARRLDLAEEGLRAHAETQPPMDADRPPRSGGRSAVAGLAPLLGLFAIAAGGALLLLSLVAAGIGLILLGAVLVGWWWRASAAVGADQDIRARLLAEGRAVWEQRRDELHARRSAAHTELAAAVTAREPLPPGDAREMLSAYEARCAERRTAADLAAQRAPLERELAARRALEAGAAAAEAAVAAAEHGLRDAVRSIGGDPTVAAEELVELLGSWRGARRREAERAEQEMAEWRELEALLGSGGLDELRGEAARVLDHARALERALPEPLAPDEAGVDEPQLQELRASLAAAQRGSADLDGGLRVLASTLPDVAEAEEQLAATERELARVQELGSAVDTALRLLRAAEERVHRDLAPILAAAVQRWLPAVSEGAYREVSVDPADLTVSVKEASTGQWRNARLLSEGTREQIYLLLRVAMAQHLVRAGEVAPLLLDEVTAQSDATRKRQLLRVLHTLSAERQVVLFSHDDEVVAWAEAHLEEPRDRIIHLPARRSLGSAESSTTAVSVG